jgi:hypothetical protein
MPTGTHRTNRHLRPLTSPSPTGNQSLIANRSPGGSRSLVANRSLVASRRLGSRRLLGGRPRVTIGSQRRGETDPAHDQKHNHHTQ